MNCYELLYGTDLLRSLPKMTFWNLEKLIACLTRQKVVLDYDTMIISSLVNDMISDSMYQI